MGFTLQLKILLWKNLTFKRRNSLVLLFELIIPLVLFVILFYIRRKQPAYPMPDYHSDAKPLPSAGVIAVMQAFCDSGKQDARGFPDFPNATVHQFLENFQLIAENNNFFDPGFSPSELERIPGLYERIIDDPAMIHNRIAQVQGLKLNQIFSHASQLADALVQNYSLPSVDVDALLSARINITELYRRMSRAAPFSRGFYDKSPGEPSVRIRRETGLRWTLSSLDYESIMKPLSGQKILWDLISNMDAVSRDKVVSILSRLYASGEEGSGLRGNLLFEILKNNPALLTNPHFARIILKLLSFDGNSGLDFFFGIDPKDLLDVLSRLLLSKPSLQHLICDDNEIEKILIFPNQSHVNVLETQSILCNMSSDQWNSLAELLVQHVKSEDMFEKLRLQDVNFTAFYTALQNFEANLEEFIMFEKNLIVLSKFSSKLPQDACGVPSIQSSVTEARMTTASSDTQAPDTKTKHQKRARDQSPNVGLLRIWFAMQKTLCGRSVNHEDRMHQSNDNIDIESIGLSGKQRRNLGILIQMLYNNPRVLYAPNTTAANEIIQKANGTFALVDEISEFARKWQHVSTRIRTYLLLNKTEQNLKLIRQMQQELQSKPGLLPLISSREVRAFLESPDSHASINRTVFLDQLDVVDNAACSWLALIRGIDVVNVFQGFSSEEELVDYFLNKAYEDGVVVLASVVFTNLNEDGSLPPHVVYKIRQNASFTSTTKSVRDKYWHPGPSENPYGYESYYQFGFVWIQDIIERAIINVQTGRDVVEPGTFIHQIPYPCYMEDKFLFMIEHVMPLCLTISWVYTVAMLVQSVVYEKEQRLKEVMRMMGLSNCVHWLAWFITSFIQMTITMALLTVILKCGSVLMYSNPVIVFLVLEMFAIATICFSFLVSACYSKKKKVPTATLR